MRRLQRVFIAIVLLLSFSWSPVFADQNLDSEGKYEVPLVPDEGKTPGDVCDERDPDFTGYRYSQRVAYCVRNVDTVTKDAIYESYGIVESQRRNYTVDHFIPLSIGGSNQTVNLWPEHKKIKQTRLTLEQEVYEAVKDGRMSQNRAIEIIVEAKMNPKPID
jgi:hypothetical protein